MRKPAKSNVQRALHKSWGGRLRGLKYQEGIELDTGVTIVIYEQRSAMYGMEDNILVGQRLLVYVAERDHVACDIILKQWYEGDDNGKQDKTNTARAQN